MLDERVEAHAEWGLKLMKALMKAGGGWIQPLRVSGLGNETPRYGDAIADLLLAGVPLQYRSARYQTQAYIDYCKAENRSVQGGLVITEIRFTGGKIPAMLTDGSIADRFPGITESPSSGGGQTRRRRSKVGTTASQSSEPRIGKNAGHYLEANYGTKPRKHAQIVKKASAIAAQRDDRLIRLEYVLIADGTIDEKALGSDEAKALRRQVHRARTGGNGSTKKTSKPVAKPRARQTRKRAGK